MADDSGTSVTTQSQPFWIRVSMPSISDLIFVAIMGMLLLTPISVKLLGDGGIGWHIRTGQLIAATKAVPHVDPFSSTMSGQPWFAWEWLYDLAMGELEGIAGLNGVVWLTAITIAAVFAGVFRLLAKRGVNICLTLGLTLLAMSASMIHFFARPHVFSWLFTLIWFWILDSTELELRTGTARRSDWKLWLLPLLMIVWVNVHGGFLIGFALLGIYWMSAAYTWAKLREERWEDTLVKLHAGRRTKQIFLVGLLAFIATLCNPYGWKLHVHIYRYLTNRFLIDHIDEFQSPNFHHAAERCFGVLMLITLITLAARKRRLRLGEGLVVLFAMYSGLYAVRNIPVSSLLLVLVMGPILNDAMHRFERGARGFFGRMKDIELSLGVHAWPVVVVIATFLVTIHGGYAGSKRLMDAHFSEKRFPVEAVNRLESGKTWSPILTPDYWGGYLIYQLYPKVQVVMDDRHDLYGEEILKDYVKMIHVEQGWENFLSEHNVCCVLVPKGSALANVLTESNDWKEIYEDGVAMAFERRHGN